MVFVVRALSRASAGAILVMSGAFLTYFLKTVWEGFRESNRSWKPVKCRAVAFDVKGCRSMERGCNGWCLYVRVDFEQDGSSHKDIQLQRRDDCKFTSKSGAREEGEKLVDGGDGSQGNLACYAVPGDEKSVSNTDLTRSGSEKTRDLFGKIFISIFIFLSGLVCLTVGTGSFVKACKYIVNPDDMRARPTTLQEGNVTEPGAAALGSLHIRKAKLEKLVAAMPTLEVTSEDGTSDQNAAECSICLDDNDAEMRVVRLPECDHHFHDRCITSWLSRGHNACPVCRAAVLPKDKVPRRSRQRSSRNREDQASFDEQRRADGTEEQSMIHEQQQSREGRQNSEVDDAPNSEANHASQVDSPPT